jgi:hypothetical protein
MSFFKKFTSKVNKKQQLNIVSENFSNIQQDQNKVEYVDNNYQQEQEEYRFDEIQNNFDSENNWNNYQQEEENNAEWNKDDNEIDQYTWSNSNQEISSQLAFEQEYQSLVQVESSSSQTTLTNNEKLVNNFNVELILLAILILLTPFYFRLFFFVLFLYKIKNTLLKLKLAEQKNILIELNPFEILFSQANINDEFRSGKKVEDTIKELVEGITIIEEIPTIQVCLIDNIFYSSDNRRLYCIQTAMKRGLQVENIKVLLMRVCDTNIQDKFEGSKIVVQNKNYLNINITPLARMNTIVYNDRSWRFQD